MFYFVQMPHCSQTYVVDHIMHMHSMVIGQLCY